MMISKDIQVQKKCKSKFIFEEIEFENWSNIGNFLSNDPIL